MALFGLFSKRTVLKIDSREIEIINESRLPKQIIKQAIHAIHEFAKRDKLVKFLPKLSIILVDSYTILGPSSYSNNEAVAYCDPNEANKVYINLSNVHPRDLSTKRYLECGVEETLTHEIAHLYHRANNHNIRLANKLLPRFEKIIAKKISEIKILENKPTAASKFWMARMVPTVALDMIQLEGFARYVDYANQLTFDHETLVKTYREAQKESLELDSLLQNIVKKIRHPNNQSEGYMVDLSAEIIKTQNEARLLCYGIGCHMVFTVLYDAKSMDLEKIARLTKFQFATKYERCCTQFGYRPVVSLTSGRGIFDYRRAISRVAKEFERYKKTR